MPYLLREMAVDRHCAEGCIAALLLTQNADANMQSLFRVGICSRSVVRNLPQKSAG